MALRRSRALLILPPDFDSTCMALTLLSSSPWTRLSRVAWLGWHSLVPCEGLRRSLAAAATSPPRWPPLLGSAALQSLVCNEVSGCLGYLIPPRRSSFPSRPRGVPLAAVPHELSPWVHPLVRSTSLQSFSSHHPLSRAEHLPWASFPLRDVDRRSPLTRASRPASFRPRRFARPRRFSPLPTSRVYFTPLPRPGFALQGLPLARSRAGSSPTVALLPFTRNPCRRLPGGARTSCPSPGPCSTRESVANDGGLDHRPLDTLLSFRLPRVFLRAP